MLVSKLFSLTLALICFAAVPAFAAEEENERAQEEKPKETPVTEWMTAENELIADLSKQEQQVFYVIRNKHSVIRSVHVVQRDVGAAVKGCGKENPDMKEDIEGRFEEWENSILPILAAAEKFLEEEIDGQTVVDPSNFEDVLDLNDEAYEYTESKIEKIPVTDESSCKKLLKSMDRTEDQLVNLLQDILLPESVIRKRADKAAAE